MEMLIAGFGASWYLLRWPVRGDWRGHVLGRFGTAMGASEVSGFWEYAFTSRTRSLRLFESCSNLILGNMVRTK